MVKGLWITVNEHYTYKHFLVGKVPLIQGRQTRLTTRIRYMLSGGKTDVRNIFKNRYAVKVTQFVSRYI